MRAELTQDAFLDGKITVWQPKFGYRAATDPVFLASAVPAKSGQSVLDVGCGVGVASLCLAQRVAGVSVTGLELQEEYAALAARNAAANVLSLRIVAGDLRDLPPELRSAQFDHVMTNPPFYPDGRATRPDSAAKSVAHVEAIGLADWIGFCLKRLRPKGSFTIIQTADRLQDILCALPGNIGAIRIRPMAPRAGRPAKRVIVQARKNSRAALQLLPPFNVHSGAEHRRDGDDYSEAAAGILRKGREFPL
jgi:tRNA1Val (adenine37-N6)-methyltransferase